MNVQPSNPGSGNINANVAGILILVFIAPTHPTHNQTNDTISQDPAPIFSIVVSHLITALLM